MRRKSHGVKVIKIEGHSVFSSDLHAGSILVDLGVNRGEFSSSLISKFELKSYGVEAEEELHSKYLTSIENLNVLNVAISDFNGRAQINRNDNFCSTILQADSHQESGSFVEAITYDKFIQHFGLHNVDLIKFDIEGSEIAVIDNCSDEQILLWKQMTIEFHDFVFPDLADDVIRVRKRLRDLGFRELHFSLDNTDVVYLNSKFFSSPIYTRFVALIAFKYIRGFIRRYLSRP
jgi:FkbM family methyltransferase